MNVRIGEDTWTSRETIILEEPVQVTATMQAGRVLVTLATRSPSPVQVHCTASGPEWLEFPEPSAEVTVPAQGSASCVIPWQAGKPGGIEEAEVVVAAWVGGREYRASAKLEPLDLSVSRWSLAKYDGEVAVSRDEAAGVLSIRSASTAVRGGWRWRTAFIEPGASYRFSVQCRTEGISSTEKGAMVRIIFFDRDDRSKAAGPWVTTEPLTGDNDWTDLSTEFVVPEKTGSIQIELFNWQASGLSEWRGMSLEGIN